MKVWVHSPFDNLPQEGFRKQRYWLMAEAFVDAGHEVVYWTSDFNHGTKHKRELTKTLTNSGIEMKIISTMPYRSNVSVVRAISHWGYARRLWKAAKREAMNKQPDIIITATPTISGAEAMRKVARECGAKLVIDIQDAWPETFKRLLPKGCKWLGKMLFFDMAHKVKRLYREAELVTGVAERYREVAGRADYKLFRHGI